MLIDFKNPRIHIIVIFTFIIIFNIGCISEGPIKKRNTLPSVAIIPSLINGTAPLTVSFKAIAFDCDGEIEKYHWDFDDNTTSSLKNPTHTFDQARSYNITLTVTDNDRGISNDACIITVVGKLYWINVINNCIRPIELSIIMRNDYCSGEIKVDLSSFLLRRSGGMIILHQSNLPTGGDVRVSLTSYIGRFPFKTYHSQLSVTSKGHSGILFTVEKDKISYEYVNYVPLEV